jgi:hypothetical protein
MLITTVECRFLSTISSVDSPSSFGSLTSMVMFGLAELPPLLPVDNWGR